MCFNKIKLKTALKQPFENNTFLILQTLTMGEHFWQFWGAIAVDKRRKE